MYFVHQFCNAHIFSYKYAIPHFIFPINRAILSEIGIGGPAIIDNVSGVGTGGEGSGVQFDDGEEGYSSGGWEDVLQLNVGLYDEIGDVFDSRGDESLTFLSPPAPGMRVMGSLT